MQTFNEEPSRANRRGFKRIHRHIFSYLSITHMPCTLCFANTLTLWSWLIISLAEAGKNHNYCGCRAMYHVSLLPSGGNVRRHKTAVRTFDSDSDSDIQPSMVTQIAHTQQWTHTLTVNTHTHTHTHRAVNTHTPWTHTQSSGHPFMLLFCFT